MSKHYGYTWGGRPNGKTITRDGAGGNAHGGIGWDRNGRGIDADRLHLLCEPDGTWSLDYFPHDGNVVRLAFGNIDTGTIGAAYEPIRYEVGHRYGYSAVDVFRGDECKSNAISGVTRKEADQIAALLRDAYRQGQMDALRGLAGADVDRHYPTPAAYERNPRNRAAEGA